MAGEEVQVFGVQFLSRVLGKGVLAVGTPRRVRLSSAEVDVTFEIGLNDGHSSFTYAQLWPQAPSIGAHEYVDDYADRRWPCRVQIGGRVGIPGPRDKRSVSLAHEILSGFRRKMWEAFLGASSLPPHSDQLLRTDGYRRTYYTIGLDAAHNPIPSPEWFLCPATVDEPVGPGFVRIEGLFEDRNEHALVWSQAISFPSRTSIEADKAAIRKRVREIQRHWNSYNEIRDAENYVNSGNAKAAVRYGAPAVEAAVKFYCSLWGVKFPNKGEFGERIEGVLAAAGKPSYQAIDPEGLKAILRLYRARNSSHEADCYYNDPDTNERVDVKHWHAQEMIGHAKRFLSWLDAIA
jgi:hypothetical protein